MSEHILSQLSRPFEPAFIEWKPGSTKGARCLAMPYADLRAYQARLDEIFGMNWSVRYTPWGDRIICDLTIHGTTRSSTGESNPKDGNAGTSAEAQAFKRACVMFGLGRYLYELPPVWVDYDSGKRAIAEAALKRIEQRYAEWYDRKLAKLAEANPAAPTMDTSE